MKIDVERNGDLKTVTFYERNQYDMISNAQYFILFNENKKDFLLMTYENFMKVAPAKWEIFDDCQYFTTPLTQDEFKLFWSEAEVYNIATKS